MGKDPCTNSILPALHRYIGNEKGGRHFIEHCVRLTNHRTFRNSPLWRMTPQSRTPRHSPADPQHIFTSIAEVQPAVRVRSDNITRVKPALLIKCCFICR